MTAAVLPGRSAYLRPSTIRSWSQAELRTWVRTSSSRGIEALVTKLAVIDGDLAAIAADAGIRMVGSFTCYSDHDPASRVPGGTRPVGPDGVPLSAMEWYRGLVPGDPAFDDRLADELSRQISDAPTDLVFLDFARWPGHWELESRNGGSPRRASFDRGTLTRFRTYLAERGLDGDGIDPSDAAASAQVIAGRLADPWTAFRATTITDIVTRLATILREAGTATGMFLVPVDHERRRRDYGQDVDELAAAVDGFAVMTYQAMTGLDAESSIHLAEETSLRARRPVIAMLQTTSDRRLSGGHDWGPTRSPEQAAADGEALDTAVRAGRLTGLCLFPGEAPMPSFDQNRSTNPVTRLEGPIR